MCRKKKKKKNRPDQRDLVVLFETHTLQHMWFTKVSLSQLRHSVTIRCNTDTCTSVQQWSINNKSTNKKKNVSKTQIVRDFCRALM